MVVMQALCHHWSSRDVVEEEEEEEVRRECLPNHSAKEEDRGGWCSEK